MSRVYLGSLPEEIIHYLRGTSVSGYGQCMSPTYFRALIDLKLAEDKSTSLGNPVYKLTPLGEDLKEKANFLSALSR
jgi:hypothetical protein